MPDIGLLFNIANTGMLLFWLPLLVAPKSSITKTLVSYPYVPLVLSGFYLFFLWNDPGITSADFSSFEGVVNAFKNASPAGVAAGWMHYLAFDFWVGCWLLADSQKNHIAHGWIILPLLCTFMLGPVGVLIYSVIRASRFFQK